MSGEEEEEYYDDEEEAEVRPEEKLLVARHFICKASAGEARALAEDLQSIMGKDLLTDEKVSEYLLDRAEKFYEFVPGEKEVIACEHSKVDGGYQNPSTGEVCTLNVSKHEPAIGDKKEGENENNSDLRQSLQSALNSHLDAHYLKELHAARACAVYENGDDVVCIISAKNSNLNSFWTGSWQCTYSLTKGGNSLEAQLKINVHYFEGGNVQLNVDKTESLECDCDNVDDVVSKIVMFENEFQNTISEFFSTNENMFKKVRRGLTIQGTKFDWRVAIHENVNDMGN